LAAEVGRLFGLYQEQVSRLLTERTQENERLRADSERLAALAMENTRLREETARLQAEREELLAASPAWRTWWNKYGARVVGAGRGKQWASTSSSAGSWWLDV